MVLYVTNSNDYNSGISCLNCRTGPIYTNVLPLLESLLLHLDDMGRSLTHVFNIRHYQTSSSGPGQQKGKGRFSRK